MLVTVMRGSMGGGGCPIPAGLQCHRVLNNTGLDISKKTIMPAFKVGPQSMAHLFSYPHQLNKQINTKK